MSAEQALVAAQKALAAAQQTINMQNLLMHEAEAGGTNKVPKLMSLDDYPQWKTSFANHVQGVDTRLWEAIHDGYVHPVTEAGTRKLLQLLDDEERKLYDYEKKAYGLMQQAISQAIRHQFGTSETSNEWWVAMKNYCEGSTGEKSLKIAELRKEFDNFYVLKGESITAVINRYFHLLSEMHANEIVTPPAKQVSQLASSLPSE